MTESNAHSKKVSGEKLREINDLIGYYGTEVDELRLYVPQDLLFSRDYNEEKKLKMIEQLR